MKPLNPLSTFDAMQHLRNAAFRLQAPCAANGQHQTEGFLPEEACVRVPGRASFLQSLRARPELLVFSLLLAICNWPVLIGSACGSLVFRPAAVEAGEWWRLFTHPWVHVTWYHLWLDGAAFLMLYQSLAERSLFRRITCVFAAGAGSLLISWWAAPAIGSGGLCGLSGVAHGLMAVSAIEMMAGRSLGSPEARFGLLTFLLVVGKALVEAIRGHMFFSFLHFGLMGDPVAVSHAGGVLGGLLAVLGLGRCARSALIPRCRSTLGRVPAALSQGGGSGNRAESAGLRSFAPG